jgi:hypothetical protein
MTPPDGTWIGTLLNVEDGRSAAILMNLRFLENGAIEGDFTDDEGKVNRLEGRWSPYGSLHLRYAPAKDRFALFDGRFDVANELHSAIWGTVLLAPGGGRQQQGALSLLHAREGKTLTNHVWS